MSWLVDHVNILYILLGIAALGLLTAGWVTRRVKFFLHAAIPLTLIGLVWLLTQLIVTDSKQIELDVHAMKDAVLRRDADALMSHVSEDFRYEGVNKAMLGAGMKKTLEMHNVTEIHITQFEIKELSREKRHAKADFLVRVDSGNDMVFFGLCVTEFGLEGDQWRLKGIDFFRHPGNQRITVPLGR